ncbi:MAG TPA: 16S rRNA (cytosine(1402)-N(4))-methyltransferase RsmH [Chthonomonadaceae bacterium]|nr:16S rRNA (cytosine(1402)-N(4))-methyltransferase RsmH [Chthonomonadaceae bacterium]
MPDHPPGGGAAYHVPVMVEEALAYLAPAPGEVFADATLGGGGHSAALAERISPGGALYGIDRDVEALETARERLGRFPDVGVTLVHSRFGDLDSSIDALPGGESLRFDGVLFDLGVSSHQLDAERGFSFRRDERLDMRMDASDPSSMTAAELLASAPEAEIARILWEYGDEKWSRRIARRIVERRAQGAPLDTTRQLAEIVEQSVPRPAWPREIHVATRTFQAVRIAVNCEIEQLQDGLRAAFHRLKPGGRLVAISYHSIEDRIVKQTFAAWAGRTPSAPGMSPAALLPVTNSNVATLLTRKPITPRVAEIERNPRARSAKLRALRRDS